jgi:hypothetical protein
MIGKLVGVFQERKLALHRSRNRRATRSSPSKHQHTLHQEIVDLILVKNLTGNELFETASSH